MFTAPALPAAGTITMFTTPWCGYCRGLKTGLDRDGIVYEEVNIERERWQPDRTDRGVP
jgi:mycoredoxin